MWLEHITTQMHFSTNYNTAQHKWNAHATQTQHIEHTWIVTKRKHKYKTAQHKQSEHATQTQHIEHMWNVTKTQNDTNAMQY